MDTVPSTHGTALPHGQRIGKVTHYFDKIGVAVVALEHNVHVGDHVVVAGHARGFEQVVGSLQYEHGHVATAHAGSSVGLKIDEPAKKGDEVFLKA